MPKSAPHNKTVVISMSNMFVKPKCCSTALFPAPAAFCAIRTSSRDWLPPIVFSKENVVLFNNVGHNGPVHGAHDYLPQSHCFYAMSITDHTLRAPYMAGSPCKVWSRVNETHSNVRLKLTIF